MGQLEAAGRAVLAAAWLWGAALTLVAVSTTPQPPASIERPVTQLLVPAFREGRLALNNQRFTDFRADEAAIRRHAEPTASWNVGMKIGLTGLASLIPLGIVWIGCAILLAWTFDRLKVGLFASRPRIKTDRRDVAALAEANRLGHLSPGASRVGAAAGCARRLRVRDQLVHVRRQAINLLRAQLRSEGVRVPTGAAETFARAVYARRRCRRPSRERDGPAARAAGGARAVDRPGRATDASGGEGGCGRAPV